MEGGWERKLQTYTEEDFSTVEEGSVLSSTTLSLRIQ